MINEIQPNIKFQNIVQCPFKHACLSLNNQTDTVLGWMLAKFNELKKKQKVW